MTIKHLFNSGATKLEAVKVEILPFPMYIGTYEVRKLLLPRNFEAH